MDVCVFMKDGSAHEIFLENALTTSAGTLFSLMMDCLSLPQEASDIFSLWLTSPLLSKQLLLSYRCIFFLFFVVALKQVGRRVDCKSARLNWISVSVLLVSQTLWHVHWNQNLLISYRTAVSSTFIVLGYYLRHMRREWGHCAPPPKKEANLGQAGVQATARSETLFIFIILIVCLSQTKEHLRILYPHTTN